MKRLWFLGAGLVVLVGIVVTAVVLWPKPFIPGKIQNAVTFTIFVPGYPQVKNQPKTVKYDSSLKFLSYQSTIFGVHSIVSEQATPQSFIDIPEVYDKVITSYNEYSSFDAAQGTVYLTRPKNQGGRQVAVMNSKGTLMFIKSDKDLTNDNWRQLFNSLNIVK